MAKKTSTKSKSKSVKKKSSAGKKKTVKKAATTESHHEFEGRRAFESNHVIPDKYLETPY